MLAPFLQLFRWPLVLAPLLFAIFALMTLLLWIEWREARRDCLEQSSERVAKPFGVVRRHR